VNGHEIGQSDMDIRRSVGILTESPGLYERLNAIQNLTLYAKLYEVNDVVGQVEKYPRLLGLWERRGEASGGLFQEVEIKVIVGFKIDTGLYGLDAGLEREILQS
jgi:ABC-2 type transport system ATP-binding protein